MAKADKTLFECTSCGAQSPKWLGKCPGCADWNSLVEVRHAPAKATASRGDAQKPVALGEISTDAVERHRCGIDEFDRVLGGGVVVGSVVLLGGDPGIGKSTLLMQALVGLAKQGKRALYVTGEESAAQVALRARRIGMSPDVLLLASTELTDVEDALAAEHFDVVVIDSVQTLRSAELAAAPGSVAQLREVAGQLTRLAKRSGTAMFLIGHVTKDGGLAGPKVLEHLVDAVLSFEGDPTHAFRLVRSTKNRYAPTHEVGVFEMVEEGLREVSDPSSLFIGERPGRAAGSVIVCTAEGSRSLLVEVQALVATAQYGSPRRVATGLDGQRLAVLLAVLERKAGVPVLDQDVFVNAAGGVRVDEPAVDLGLSVAVASALRERPLAEGVAIFGEVGLAGEVRAVSRAVGRVAEARKMGLTRVLLPRANAERLTQTESAGIELVAVSTVAEALEFAF